MLAIRRLFAALSIACVVACSPRQNSFIGAPDARGDDVAPPDAAGMDAAVDAVVPLDAGVGDAPGDVASVYDTSVDGDACASADGAVCSPRPGGCATRETCSNGLDDDCNGRADDGCACIPGTVQDCFLGPPALRRVGACRDGTQRCVGSGEFGTWSACGGGISPSPEACDNLDNDCNGCVDEGRCCRPRIDCPGPRDPRVPDGRPFVDYPLRGAAFYPGPAIAWRWTVRGGPCDTLLPAPTFTLQRATQQDAVFRPTLSGDYTVTYTVTTMDGEDLSCTFVVHVAGPGLRVELCWDTSTTVDLDLYLHDPRNMGPWFDSTASPFTSVNMNSCNWSNCEAVLRGGSMRSDWGYPRSPLAECENGPHGPGWRSLGYCGNPRLDIDNNLVKATGVPENINVDTPRNGERFRVMVQNFSGRAAQPMVNVYCGGHLRGTVGAAPDVIPDFTGSGSTVGAMWRALDVVVNVDASGVTTGCTVTPLHPPGSASGHWVTRDDPSY